MSHNHPDIFSNLRAVRLETFAHIWAKRFPFIKSISFYQKPDDDFNFRVKYVMLFELSGLIKTDKYEEYNGQFGKLLKGSNALKWLGEAMSSDFKEVYKETQHDNFINEWRFVTKLPEGISEKHSWMLFSRTDKEKTTKHKPNSVIQDLIIKAKPELEILHQALVEKVTFSAYIENREKKFQEAALNRFKEKSNEFQFVKLEYLEDRELYNFFRPEQEKGDFIGKLLKRIFRDNDLGAYGYQKCYKIYKDVLKSITDKTNT